MAIKTRIDDFLLIVYPVFYGLEQFYLFSKHQTNAQTQDSSYRVISLHIEGADSLSIFKETHDVHVLYLG